jgi:hypothetical protein
MLGFLRCGFRSRSGIAITCRAGQARHSRSLCSGSQLTTIRVLRWLEAGLDLSNRLTSATPTTRFEVELEPTLLNEHPFVTTIDFLVEDTDVVMCVEAKLGENGFGSCRCSSGASQGACSERVLGRQLYWEAARDVFLLPDRVEGQPCPIAACYQAVRNVAAARALAGPDRRAVFVLVYDERNPFFRSTGSWPGWPVVLRCALRDAELMNRLVFRAISWQNSSRVYR